MATSRRSFLSDMFKACVGASILPAALTYNRKWKYDKTYTLIAPVYILNPLWVAKHNEITPGRFIEVTSQKDIVRKVCNYRDKFYTETIFYKKTDNGFFKIV